MTKRRSILYTVLALSTLLALPAASLGAPKRKAYRPSTSSQSSDTPAPPPANGDAFNVTSAMLIAITSDQHGKVENVAVRKGSDVNTYAGCGMALANVPHLVDALGEKRRLALRIENGCIRRITVGNE